MCLPRQLLSDDLFDLCPSADQPVLPAGKMAVQQQTGRQPRKKNRLAFLFIVRYCNVKTCLPGSIFLIV